MKLKLAIIFGILIWVITFLATKIINPIFSSAFSNMNIIVPIILIITTTFFGILYIRDIDENEVIEGLTVGIVFIAVDVICDLIFLIIPKSQNLIFADYELHIFSMIVITLLITTFLGYLAQMNIDLK